MSEAENTQAPAVCKAEPGCSTNVLPTLAALTLGIGVGALGGVALSRSAIVLFLIGCFVHLWCIVRQRLAGGSSPRWIAVLNGVAWAAIVVAAGLVAFAGIGT